jgi:hypothetical protein
MATTTVFVYCLSYINHIILVEKLSRLAPRGLRLCLSLLLSTFQEASKSRIRQPFDTHHIHRKHVSCPYRTRGTVLLVPVLYLTSTATIYCCSTLSTLAQPSSIFFSFSCTTVITHFHLAFVSVLTALQTVPSLPVLLLTLFVAVVNLIALTRIQRFFKLILLLLAVSTFT